MHGFMNIKKGIIDFFAVEYTNKKFDNFCLYIPLHGLYGSFHGLPFIEISLLSYNLFCSSSFSVTAAKGVESQIYFSFILKFCCI
jgi:hypothetical protein